MTEETVQELLEQQRLGSAGWGALAKVDLQTYQVVARSAPSPSTGTGPARNDTEFTTEAMKSMKRPNDPQAAVTLTHEEAERLTMQQAVNAAFEAKHACSGCKVPSESPEGTTPLFEPMAALGRKDSRGDPTKLLYDLVAPEMEEALAAVLTYGARRYGARNWEKGIPMSELYAATRRHMVEWLKGGKDESGFSHLWHAFTDLGMLLTMEARRPDLDDVTLPALKREGK